VFEPPDHVPHRLRGHHPDQPPRLRVSWQDTLPLGGVVVSNDIDVAIDVEAHQSAKWAKSDTWALRVGFGVAAGPQLLIGGHQRGA
jgi:hypothetical protein